MNRLQFFILMILMTSVSMANPELKGNPDELRKFLHPSERIVTINGQAVEKAYSDKAIVSIVIMTKDKLLSASISKNSKLRDAISSKLVAVGIDQDNIKNSKFSSSPHYGWFGKKPKNYKVVNRMAITISEEIHLEKIAEVADKHEEVELSGTTFEHSKKEEYKEKVKDKAVKDAMKQKEFYEKRLNVKLTPVSFRDSRIAHQATRGARLLEEVVVTARKSQSLRVREAPASIAAYSVDRTPSFDEIKYEANVSVDFKIVPAGK